MKAGVWVYLVHAQVHLCTDTPFWPPADKNAIGGTLWRTESHSKNRKGNSTRRNEICAAISSPTHSFQSDWRLRQREKKSSNTWQERLFSPCNNKYWCSFAHSHSNICFCNSKHHEIKWIKSPALCCTEEAAISRSSSWKRDSLNSSWDVVLPFCLNTHMN